MFKTMFTYFTDKVTFPEQHLHGDNRTLVNFMHLYPGSFMTQISFN